ncbi:bidirectional sugar transporter SWEET17 isoform X2 [Eutrema salsugineum]|uniref:bidirectional sugar transporter SWEET17 isoform X2 n=1 Tax=Eutrema salsugineum TaxID=72664 RepID=UPI000CECFC57|nr:bidirectional sugar transporter SWEET17 isoform X2 [Eutrema salsugineum]
MVETSFYIGIIGNVISILVFLSPVETFWKIVKRKSTEEYKSLPYICTLLGSSLWTYYGIVTPREYLVSTVNGFGTEEQSDDVSELLQLGLLFGPVFWTCRLNTIVVVSLLNVLFPIAAIAATRSAFKDEKTRSQSMGFICAGLNIVMYGSPLSAMVPNGVGFVFGTMQLILYGIYRNAKPVGLSNGSSVIAADEEEGLASHVPLLS